jgi:uncharacterized protein (DUF4213/DUF364 family)
MSTLSEIREMALDLAARSQVPKIAGIVLPTLYEQGQPKACEFMALALDSGAGGVSYVSIPTDSAEDYRALHPQSFVGSRPEQFVEALDGSDPIRNMLGLACINVICQHVMRLCDYSPGVATDSLGLMHIEDEDRVGMVGFFPPLLKYLQNSSAELIIVEKNESLVDRYPNLHVTLDATELNHCNKVLCTSTTILNNTIDEVLKECTAARHISVLGPTAGYFPDPLFAKGVDVLGGRFVSDGMLLLRLIAERKPWSVATQKLCFQASDYEGLDNLCSSIFSCN